MVNIENGIWRNAIRPNVQTRASPTHTRGIRMYRGLRNRKKKIMAISKKVMGGKREKSFSVNLASASETSGIPV